MCSAASRPAAGLILQNPVDSFLASGPLTYNRAVVGASTLLRDGVRRSVFFFRSENDLLYGSLYAAAPMRTPAGIVICPAWGWESLWMNDGLHVLAREAAAAGGAALLFHWPGHGDSEGAPEDASLDRMVQAARDAAATAHAQAAGTAWSFAGVRLGAVAAARAAASAGADRLLLVQPVLNPAVWLGEMDRLAGGTAGDWVAGFPVSERVRRAAEHAPAEDLQAFGGRVAVACYETMAPLSLPEKSIIRKVPGDWRRRIRSDHLPLFEAAAGLLGPLMAA
jgi:hypothetical protein